MAARAVRAIALVCSLALCDGCGPIPCGVHSVDGVLRGMGRLACHGLEGLHGDGHGLGKLTLAVPPRSTCAVPVDL